MTDLAVAVAVLDARVAALEARLIPRTDRALTLGETCARLGLSRSAFYRLERELVRRGLLEVVTGTRSRRFDAASVEAVRIGRHAGRAGIRRGHVSTVRLTSEGRK